MKKFRIYYAEQKPGWDEFMYSRDDECIIEAETKELALVKFRADSLYRHCFDYLMQEVVK